MNITTLITSRDMSVLQYSYLQWSSDHFSWFSVCISTSLFHCISHPGNLGILPGNLSRDPAHLECLQPSATRALAEKADVK